MDNELAGAQQVAEPQTEQGAPIDTGAAEPQTQEDTRSFDQLTEAEQREVLREAFWGEQEGDDEPEDGDADGEDGEQAHDEPEQSGEPEEEQQAEGTAPQGEAVNVYTPEEFLMLAPDEVDSKRLPEAARIVHERDMQYYNQTIAPQLAELARLRQFHADVMNRMRAAQTQQQPNNAEPDYAAFNQQVKAEAARRLGVESIDEFNADHQIMVARIAAQMENAQAQQAQQRQAAQYQQQQAAQNVSSVLGALQAEYGTDFAVIDRYARTELDNLPHKSYEQVVNDLRSGDAAKIRGVYKLFADRYAAQKKAAQPAPQPVKKNVQAPPRVIGGSTGDTGNRGWGLSDFKNASPQGQREMLADFFRN